MAALLLSENANLYNDDITQIIRASADKVPDMNGQDFTEFYGYGRVNARRALNFLQAPYVLGQNSYGSAFIAESADWDSEQFVGVPGIPNGWYYVKQHTVNDNVTFPEPFAVAPRVWGRGVSTIGFSDDLIESQTFGLNWCEPVSGTITSTGATLMTYTYELRIFIPNLDPEDCPLQGWYPAPVHWVVLAITALGIQTIPPPQNLSISNNGGNPMVSWDAVNIDPTDLDGYHVYRKVGSGSWSRLTGSPQSGTSYLDHTIAFSNKFRGVWIQYHITTVVGGVESAPSANKGIWGDPLWKETVQTVVLPQIFALHENFPNPFNPTSTIKYDLPTDSFVELMIYDLLGREIKTLIYGNETAGFKSAVWDGKDYNGNAVSSGMYIYRFSAVSRESDEVFNQTRKMALLK